ncbi:hypothetical protein DM56_4402 [Burkholderia mallei]|nr:hypothetical protein DM45_3512 [Burkholderia mallei]KOS98245.1 hypothetical protein DM49_3504 [Burkholderia mallei]KOT11680.1 hypothetical protein DM56_4402 [Burkholderia mallei]KOT20142.1 hypothetical protein DM47_2920 [Burkholderia mallei]
MPSATLRAATAMAVEEASDVRPREDRRISIQADGRNCSAHGARG